jgi:hypothetical protein
VLHGGALALAAVASSAVGAPVGARSVPRDTLFVEPGGCERARLLLISGQRRARAIIFFLVACGGADAASVSKKTGR